MNRLVLELLLLLILYWQRGNLRGMTCFLPKTHQAKIVTINKLTYYATTWGRVFCRSWVFCHKNVFISRQSFSKRLKMSNLESALTLSQKATKYLFRSPWSAFFHVSFGFYFFKPMTKSINSRKLWGNFWGFFFPSRENKNGRNLSSDGLAIAIFGMLSTHSYWIGLS